MIEQGSKQCEKTPDKQTPDKQTQIEDSLDHLMATIKKLENFVFKVENGRTGLQEGKAESEKPERPSLAAYLEELPTSLKKIAERIELTVEKLNELLY